MKRVRIGVAVVLVVLVATGCGNTNSYSCIGQCNPQTSPSRTFDGEITALTPSDAEEECNQILACPSPSTPDCSCLPL